MIHERVGNYHRKQFSSMLDMTEYVERSWDAYKQQRAPNHLLYDEGFLGKKYTTIQQVIKDIHSPWEYGLTALESMLSKLSHHTLTPPQSIRRRTAWNEDGGDEICLDRLRTGQPYWRTTHRDHRLGPINVTIVTPIATSGFKNHQEIIWRGAASICLTKLLEQAGYRVELLSVNAGGDNAYQSGRYYLNSTQLKGPSDPLDESTLVNAISGWAYRTLYFASTYQEGEQKHRELMGTPLPLDGRLHLFTSDNQTLLCKEIWSELAAVRWVQQQLEKFKTGVFPQQ